MSRGREADKQALHDEPIELDNKSEAAKNVKTVGAKKCNKKQPTMCL